MSTIDINLYRYNQNSEADSGARLINKKMYADVIGDVREHLSVNHARRLSELLDSADSKTERYIKKLIGEYILDRQITVAGCEMPVLINKLFEDMAGIGHIKKYILDDGVEEINCNAWNDVEVVTGEGWKKIEPFVNSGMCYDITQKMCRLGGLIINENNPQGDSFMAPGIRISAMVPPVVDEERGATFSIRKQGRRIFSKDEYVENGVAMREEIDFLSLCVNNGVSVAFCGGTGSGKTTDMSVILNAIPEDYRLFVIEDTRELNLLKVEDGLIKNRVIHTRTSENDSNPIEMHDLLKICMRYHPDVIVPAEMRDKVALTAVEAGRTGHTIVTSLHSNSARDGYKRILTMCMQSGTALSEEIMLENIIESFPIIVYKKQLKDMSRKFMEIFESERVEGKGVVGRTLYEYRVERNVTENGRVKNIVGGHRHVNSISDKLAHRLLDGGASMDEIGKYADGDWKRTPGAEGGI